MFLLDGPQISQEVLGLRWIITRLVLGSVLVIQAPLFPFLFSSVCPSSVRLFDLGSGPPVEPVQGSCTGVQSSPTTASRVDALSCPRCHRDKSAFLSIDVGVSTCVASLCSVLFCLCQFDTVVLLGVQKPAKMGTQCCSESNRLGSCLDMPLSGS